MHPFLGNQDWLTAYGLFLIIALASCWWLARRAAARAGVDPSHIDLALPLVFIVGAACVALAVGPRIRLYPLVFGCTGALFAYSVVAKQSFRTLLDVFALPAIAAIAIQRIGCFLAGCCWLPATARIAVIGVFGTILTVANIGFMVSDNIFRQNPDLV